MGGWRIAMTCAVAGSGALFFLKLIADSVASTTADIESLERAREKALFRQRELAARKARKAQESDVIAYPVSSGQGAGESRS